MPAWEMDVLLHLIHHLASRIEWTGPPWCCSMFPFERAWHTVDSWRTQQAHPCATIMNSYRAFVCAISQCPGGVISALKAGWEAAEAPWLQNAWSGADPGMSTAVGESIESDDEEEWLQQFRPESEAFDMLVQRARIADPVIMPPWSYSNSDPVTGYKVEVVSASSRSYKPGSRRASPEELAEHDRLLWLMHNFYLREDASYLSLWD